MRFSPASTRSRSYFTCLTKHSRTLPCASRQRHPKDSSPPLHGPPGTLKRLPINYSSSLIGLFSELSSLPGSLATLASFSLVLHLAAPSPGCWVSQPSIPLNSLALYLTLLHSEAPPCRTPSRPPALDPVDSGRLLGLCHPALHGPGSSWDCRRVLHTELHRTISIDMIRLVVALHSSRCTRLNREVLCIVQLCFNAASTEPGWTKSDKLCTM